MKHVHTMIGLSTGIEYRISQAGPNFHWSYQYDGEEITDGKTYPTLTSAINSIKRREDLIELGEGEVL